LLSFFKDPRASCRRLLAEVDADRASGAVATSSSASNKPAAPAITTAMVRWCRVKCLVVPSASR
jgi:hypothetical protein